MGSLLLKVISDNNFKLPVNCSYKGNLHCNRYKCKDIWKKLVKAVKIFLRGDRYKAVKDPVALHKAVFRFVTVAQVGAPRADIKDAHVDSANGTQFVEISLKTI